jgi:hypothetical protein
MENEKFISYGPEDKERGLRFKMLGYKVEWLNNLVYHIEHSRGINSSNNNPHIQNNHLLLRMINSLTKSQLTDYYNKIDYIKKYKRAYTYTEQALFHFLHYLASFFSVNV